MGLDAHSYGATLMRAHADSQVGEPTHSGRVKQTLLGRVAGLGLSSAAALAVADDFPEIGSVAVGIPVTSVWRCPTMQPYLLKRPNWAPLFGFIIFAWIQAAGGRRSRYPIVYSLG
jgi:hypothetical protein